MRFLDLSFRNVLQERDNEDLRSREVRDVRIILTLSKQELARGKDRQKGGHLPIAVRARQLTTVATTNTPDPLVG